MDPSSGERLVEVELSTAWGLTGKAQDEPPAGAQDNVPLLPSPSPPSVKLSSERDSVTVDGAPQFEGSSIASSVFNLSTTVVGAGIMALPATLRVLGLPLGIAVILFMGFLSEASVEMLVRGALRGRQVATYGELVERQLNRKAKLLLQVLILINNVGICIAYLIIVADVISGTGDDGAKRHTGLLEEWTGVRAWWNGRPFVVCVTSVAILGPLVAQTQIDSLKWSSLVAIALAVLFVIATTAVALLKFVEGQLEAPRMTPDISSTSAIFALCTIIPVMSNAFICHFNVHPIYGELRDRSERAMLMVSRASLALCTAVYLATSLSGYLLFGAATDGDVLTNFDHHLSGVPFDGALNAAVRFGYALHVVLVFPLIHFALRQTAYELLFPAAVDAACQLADQPSRLAGLTVSAMTAVTIGAAVVPNIWVAFQFTGATSGVAIGFIFPALLALRNKSGVFGRGFRALAKTMLALGVAASVIGVVSSTFNLFRNRDAELVEAWAPAPSPYPL